MYKITITTSWTGNGSDADPNRAVIADTYPMAWTDATGQPVENIQPSPNLLVIEAVVDEETLADMLDGGLTPLTVEDL